MNENENSKAPRPHQVRWPDDYRKDHAQLARTLSLLALNASDDDLRPALRELSQRAFRKLAGKDPSPLSSVEQSRSPQPNVKGNDLRPCFQSQAQEDEFEIIVRLIVRNLSGCGEEHAMLNARSLAGLSYDPEVIIRCAKADFEAAGGKRL